MKLNELKSIIKEVLKEETIFVPRNIEGRKEKVKQTLLKQLDQKIINGFIKIDGEYIPDNFIAKVEKINGSARIQNCKNLKFLKNLKEVTDDFYCSWNRLTSLEGCPEIIGNNFSCDFNQLTSLKNGPKIVKGFFYCQNNKEQFSKEDVEKYCDVKGLILTT